MADLDRSISQFPAASALDPSDLLFLSAEDLSAASGYQSKYIDAGTLAQNLLSSFQFPLLLNTTAKNVIGALNEFKAGGAVVMTGTATPSASDGVDGNVFVKYSTAGNVTTITNLYVKISGAWEEVSTGGGGGSSTLAGLTDVDLTTPTDGQVLSYDGTNNKWVNASGGGGSSASGVYIGTCSTAGATSAKEVTVSSDQNFVLEKGTTICVHFSNNNTASNVTISVNNGTAYPIWYSTGAYTGSTGNVTGNAGANFTYVFDGSYWVWVSMGKYNSYNAMTQAQAEAGTSTSNFVLSPTVLKSGVVAHAPSAVRTELTQAQYDQLSSAEKNNGKIYFITDAPSNPVDYSTSEKVIGHWIDGSTLYERTFDFNLSDMSGGTQQQSTIIGRFDLPHELYDHLWIEQAYIMNEAPTSTFQMKSLPLPAIQNNGTYIRTYIQETDANDGYPFIFIDVQWSVSQLWDNRNVIHYVYTLRYTKVTV